MKPRKAVIQLGVLAGLVAAFALAPLVEALPLDVSFLVRSLDGSGNNIAHPDWGRANTQYVRVAAPNYADRIAQPVSGPSARYVSNRIFNDTAQNLFSENGVTQWGFVWGQFLDHTFGLRQEAGGESAPLAFDKTDPIEEFQNDFGSISFNRTPAAPGTGSSRRGTGSTPGRSSRGSTRRRSPGAEVATRGREGLGRPRPRGRREGRRRR